MLNLLLETGSMPLPLCNLCGWPLFPLPAPAKGRCVFCFSTQIHRGVGTTVETLGLVADSSVYELSSRGALVRYLQGRFRKLHLSEFFDSVRPGDFCNGIQCQDVQALQLPDNYFDLVTSTEVFEHVPDDRRGFREIARVLKHGGWFVFTVPLLDSEATVERAKIEADGTISFLTHPEYHFDRLRGKGKVLAFRTYGRDICQRLVGAGFEAAIRVINDPVIGVTNQSVIVAKKVGLL